MIPRKYVRNTAHLQLNHHTLQVTPLIGFAMLAIVKKILEDINILLRVKWSKREFRGEQ